MENTQLDYTALDHAVARIAGHDVPGAECRCGARHHDINRYGYLVIVQRIKRAGLDLLACQDCATRIHRAIGLGMQGDALQLAVSGVAFGLEPTAFLEGSAADRRQRVG